MARPKRRAGQTAGKVSGGKGSGGKGPGGKQNTPSVGSVGSVVGSGNPVGGQERSKEVPAVDILRGVGSIPAPVASELAGVLSSDLVSPDELSMPVYGNYCGMGHGDPTGEMPPVDAVDAVCREHDMCYESLGDFEPCCDLELIQSMPDAIASTESPLGKQAGVMALLYFSVAERNLSLGRTLLDRT